MIKLEKGMRILFQGDSITDAGRNREDFYNWGGGYVSLVGAFLQGCHPELDLEIINKGISCECTIDMLNRWEEDTIKVHPDVMVFMGGVNDMWRRYDGADTITTAEAYEANLRAILDKSLEAGIKQILLMEPYLTMNEPDRHIWFEEDLVYKQAVVKKLAKEYNTEFIPLHDLFQEACKVKEPSYWTVEGVHPKWPGCALIAKAVLKVFGYEMP